MSGYLLKAGIFASFYRQLIKYYLNTILFHFVTALPLCRIGLPLRQHIASTLLPLVYHSVAILLPRCYLTVTTLLTLVSHNIVMILHHFATTSYHPLHTHFVTNVFELCHRFVTTMSPLYYNVLVTFLPLCYVVATHLAVPSLVFMDPIRLRRRRKQATNAGRSGAEARSNRHI